MKKPLYSGHLGGVIKRLLAREGKEQSPPLIDMGTGQLKCLLLAWS